MSVEQATAPRPAPAVPLATFTNTSSPRWFLWFQNTLTTVIVAGPFLTLCFVMTRIAGQGVALRSLVLAVLLYFVIGHGVKENGQPVFRKLRPHGVHYAKVDDRNGYETILKAVAARAARYPEPFAHWRVEGGSLDSFKADGLTSISYASLTPVRAQLQSRIQKAFESGTGSEALRTALAKVRPEDVGLHSDALNHFELSLLTEGSGTQIFSTTFVQWSAREIWRRAQPVTLLARFTERQKEDASREMFLETRRTPQLDPDGSLVDAEMGAYYTWINQQRLTGAAAAKFLVWFENQGQALVIAPGMQKGSTSAAPTPLAKLIGEVS